MPLSTRLRVFGPAFAALFAALSFSTFGLASAADVDAGQAIDLVPGPAPKLKVDPLDWPYWRGPEANGISRETGIPDDFDVDAGTNVLWQNDELGTRNTPICMHGKLYMTCNYKPRTDREGEMVVCADAETGKILWRTHFNVFLAEVPDTRVGWPSVVGDPETGRVYCQGVGGLFLCLEGDTGKVVWSRSMSEEFGLITPYGGRTNSPVVFEDLVIISGVMTNWGELSRPVHRFMGMKKATGETVWYVDTRVGPEDTTYSVPVLTTLGGQAALVAGAADGALYAIQPRTGKIIWKFQLSPRGLNLTPLVVGNTVFMGNAEENIDDNTQGCLVAVDGTGAGDVNKTHEIWRAKALGSGRASPVLVGDKLYFPYDNGKVGVLDPKTGEEQELLKVGTSMRGSILYADNKLFVPEANGRWITYKLGGKTPKPVVKARLKGEIHGSPLISHGRLYIPTTETVYCIGLPKPTLKADPIPPAAPEKPAADDQTPAWVQITPVENLLKPGDKLPLTVKLFNKNGQFLKETKDAKFTLTPIDPMAKAPPTGFGEVEDGVYTAVAAPNTLGFHVIASVGELQGKARVRIVPALPWKFTFDSGQIPAAWIGMRGRNVIREVDGNQVMVKITTIPRGTRSQGWFGPSNLRNYTVQADVMGAETGGKKPDIGLTCQRYRFDLMGESQLLKLYSWTAHEIKYKDTPFQWKANVWYTMKFRVNYEKRNGETVAVLQGKVWPRDQKEPAEWTAEAVEFEPDFVGSPGIFGNAKDAEVFYDNIIVTPND